MADVVELSDPLEAFHSLEPADKEFDVTWVSTKVIRNIFVVSYWAIGKFRVVVFLQYSRRNFLPSLVFSQ